MQHNVFKVYLWCSMDQDFILSESTLLMSSPGSSDEWTFGRKRMANSHKVKVLVIIQVQVLNPPVRCVCLGSPTGNRRPCWLLASSRD